MAHDFIRKPGSTFRNHAQMTLRESQRPLPQRLLWFVALWLLGVGTVAIVSYGLRLWIAPH